MIFGIKEKFIILTHTLLVFLAIATNISLRLKTRVTNIYSIYIYIYIYMVAILKSPNWAERKGFYLNFCSFQSKRESPWFLRWSKLESLQSCTKSHLTLSKTRQVKRRGSARYYLLYRTLIDTIQISCLFVHHDLITRSSKRRGNVKCSLRLFRICSLCVARIRKILLP